MYPCIIYLLSLIRLSIYTSICPSMSTCCQSINLSSIICLSSCLPIHPPSIHPIHHLSNPVYLLSVCLSVHPSIHHLSHCFTSSHDSAPPPREPFWTFQLLREEMGLASGEGQRQVAPNARAIAERPCARPAYLTLGSVPRHPPFAPIFLQPLSLSGVSP